MMYFTKLTKGQPTNIHYLLKNILPQFLLLILQFSATSHMKTLPSMQPSISTYKDSTDIKDEKMEPNYIGNKTYNNYAHPSYWDKRNLRRNKYTQFTDNLLVQLFPLLRSSVGKRLQEETPPTFSPGPSNSMQTDNPSNGKTVPTKKTKYEVRPIVERKSLLYMQGQLSPSKFKQGNCYTGSNGMYKKSSIAETSPQQSYKVHQMHATPSSQPTDSSHATHTNHQTHATHPTHRARVRYLATRSRLSTHSTGRTHGTHLTHSTHPTQTTYGSLPTFKKFKTY